MGDDKKDPVDQLKEIIKIGVTATNTGLNVAQTAYEKFKEPLTSTYQSFEENSSVAAEHAKALYAKRKQYGPEIMTTTAAFSGGYFWLKRGKIAAIFGAALGTSVAYSVVYDEFPPIDAEKFPNMIFGKGDK